MAEPSQPVKQNAFFNEQSNPDRKVKLVKTSNGRETLLITVRFKPIQISNKTKCEVRR